MNHKVLPFVGAIIFGLLIQNSGKIARRAKVMNNNIHFYYRIQRQKREQREQRKQQV